MIRQDLQVDSFKVFVEALNFLHPVRCHGVQFMCECRPVMYVTIVYPSGLGVR